MDKEKDLNKSQSVADADLKDQVVAGSDLINQVVADEAKTLADGTDENKTVKYSEMKKAIEARDAAEEKAQLLKSQMDLLTANQLPEQSARPVQPKTTMEQAMTEVGVTADEMYGEAMVKVMNRKYELDVAQSQQMAAGFANHQFEATHPDFGTVVGIRHPVTKQIIPSAEIQKILTEKPHLAASAYSSSQAAYQLVMDERKLKELEQQVAIQAEHQKQKDIDIKTSVVSGAAAGTGAVKSTPGTITREQQEEIERQVASGKIK